MGKRGGMEMALFNSTSSGGSTVYCHTETILTIAVLAEAGAVQALLVLYLFLL